MRNWILNHDDSWLFMILYVGLAVVLSLWISLFWLLVVVAAHGVLEWVRQREIDPGIPGVLARIAWELKLDVALFVFALGLSIYMEPLLGVVGLRGAARAGVHGAGRFAIWQNALHGFLLSVDDAAQVARMVAARRARNADARNARVGSADEDGDPGVCGDGPQTEPFSKWGGWTEKWGRGDWFAIGFGLMCIGFILLGPVLTDHDYPSIVATFAAELHPWPSDD